MNKIGIRREDKYEFEKRTPIIPAHIQELTEQENISFSVESSAKRIYSDSDYRNAGANVIDNLAECDVIFGVKEMPENYFQDGKVYVFFSHVIKGQPYNMQMLKNLMDRNATLIDYEKIENEKGQRLIFFGRYAGLAGMINTLWTAGKRFSVLGWNTPLGELKQTHHYNSLDEAKSDVKNAGLRMISKGLPNPLKPLIIAVTGDGNVSQGAMEILDLLPGDFISAEELRKKTYPKENEIVKVNLLVSDYMAPNNNHKFDLNHYINYPDAYKSAIKDYLPFIDILVNGIYWDERYPRIITKEWLHDRDASGDLNLKVIGDITCDVHGSIECTELPTPIENPVFVYNPKNDSFEMGFDGEGVAIMAVDILPSELPKEASVHFSKALKPYLKAFAETDFSKSFDQLALPDEIKKAVIVHKGELLQDYRYLEKSLPH